MQKNHKKQETRQDENKESPIEGLGPDTTTGSGYSEADRARNDGSSTERPFDPEHPDFPGKDSRH